MSYIPKHVSFFKIVRCGSCRSLLKKARHISLLLILLWCAPSAQPESNPAASQQGPSASDKQDVVSLALGGRVERELAIGQKHVYQLTLAEGQYANLIVEQRGIDVLVRVLGGDVKPAFDFDSELRNHGLETVEFVAESAGIYQVVVEPKALKAPAGKYEIRLDELRAATEGDRSLQEARRLLAESVSLRRAGKYDQALPPGERALEIRERLLGSEHPDVASSLGNLGEVFRMKADYTKSEQLHNRALAIREKKLGPEHPDSVSSLNNLAILQYVRGKFDQAEQLYRRALGGWEKALGPEHPLVATSLQNLAIVYGETGSYDKAEQLYNRALEIRERVLGPEHRDVATTLNNLAIVYRNKGDFDKAEQLYQRALKIREKVLGPEHPELAPTLQNLAIIYRSRWDYDKAEQFYKRALEIYEKALSPEHPLVASSLNNLGTVYLDRGEFDKAEQLFKRALEIREKALGPEHPNVASTLHNLSVVYRHKGDYEKAEQTNQRAINIAEKALGLDHPNVAEMLNDLAVLYGLKNNPDQALTAQVRADEIIEHNIALNLVVGSERQKLAYLDSLSEPTDRTLSLYVRFAPNNPEAHGLAATTVLRRKGRALDALADSLTMLRRRFSEQDQKLLDQLNDAVDQLSRLVLNGPQQATPADHQQKIKALEGQREKLEVEISRRSAEFRAGLLPVTLAAVRAAVPANAALIEFTTYHPFDPTAESDRAAYKEPRYMAYVLSRTGEVRWHDLGDAKSIDDAIDAWREALRDPKRNDVKHLARAVDDKVMKGLRTLIGDATHLLISPDGELNLIPFEALVDEQGHYLIERYAFTYLTSGRDLLRMQVARESRSQPLVVANPSFGEPAAEQIVSAEPRGHVRNRSLRSVTSARSLSETYFAPLSGTAQEASAIRSFFPEASVFTGVQATESVLKQTTAPRLLHIATHGFFLSEPGVPAPRSARSVSSTTITNPLLRSGLALANANRRSVAGDDGILTALEASGLNLWGTKLVVLSACDTGVGEVRNGEGVYGLRRAFVLAGAESLVMSLWPVSDYQTKKLMTEFYQNLKLGSGRGAALRQAQLKMVKAKLHPFYWANFIQSGEWANLDGKR